MTTRRGPGLLALAAAGVLWLLPAMAEAQLFPNLPIKRQREACAAEPPFYGQVRRDYFGYFPTCWSKFPEGWACPCPNPELPNAAAEFQARPRDTPRDPGNGDQAPAGPDAPDDGMATDPPANDTNLPPVPNPGRSPFDLDGPGTTAPPLGRDPAAAPAPAQPGGNPSVPPATRTPPPTTLREMPSLPAVSPSPATTRAESNLMPGSMAMMPEATLASNRPAPRPDLGPLPPAPAVNPGMMAEPEPTIGVPAPAQAPQRRSLLGGMFGRGDRRRR